MKSMVGGAHVIFDFTAVIEQCSRASPNAIGISKERDDWIYKNSSARCLKIDKCKGRTQEISAVFLDSGCVLVGRGPVVPDSHYLG